MTTDATRLAATIAALQRRIETLERAGRLAHASARIDGETVTFTDTARNAATATTDAARALDAATTAAAKADGAVTTYHTPTAPDTADLGDFWRNTATGDLYTYDPDTDPTWQPVTSETVTAALDAAAHAEATADGKTTAYYTPTDPTATTPNPVALGDVWFDTSDGNRLRWWDGAAWQDARDQLAVDADATARDAIATATDAEQTATTALATADGKNTVTWGTAAPTAAGSATGDIYYRQNTTGDVIGVYRWTGSAWVTHQLTDATVKSLTASKITTGVLQAGTAIHTGPTNAAHTTLSTTGLTTYGGDGTTELVQLGTGSADRLAVADGAGGVVAAINADGSAAFTAVSSDSYTLNATDPAGGYAGGALTDWFNRRPRGVVAFGGRYTDSNLNTGEHPIYEVSFTSQRGRLYRFTTSAHRVDSALADTILVMRLRYTASNFYNPGATAQTAPAPTNDSQLLTEAIQPTGAVKITALMLQKLFQWDDTPTGQYAGQLANIRLRVSVVSFGTNQSKLIANVQAGGVIGSPAELIIEDVGPARKNLARVLDTQTAPPAPPPQEYTLERAASWVATWRGTGSKRTDTSEAIQGQTSYYTANGNHVAAIGFPDVTGDLAGASVKAVYLYVRMNHSEYGDGADVVIGTHNVGSEPGSPPAGWRDRKRRHFTRGEGVWWDITDMEPDGWRTGAVRGIMVGPGPTTSGLYYARIDGGSSPRLRIVYQK